MADDFSDLEAMLRRYLKVAPTEMELQAQAQLQEHFRRGSFMAGGARRPNWSRALAAVMVLALVALGSIGMVRLAALRNHHLATRPPATKHITAPVQQPPSIGWTQLNPATIPSGDVGPSTMAYDSASGTIILMETTVVPTTNASLPLAFATQMWYWDGSTWTQLHPSHLPPPMKWSSMAYDAANRTLVLFGGWILKGGGSSDATWIWNGSDWSQAQPAQSPPVRSAASMAYDAATQTVILFGGCDLLTWGMPPTCPDNVSPTDTWSWNGKTWTLLHPATSPPGREFGALAYDRAIRTVVLLGGECICNSAGMADTWSWDGRTWSQSQPIPSPPGPMGGQVLVGLAYDQAIGELIVYGVSDPNNSNDTTWTWNGSTWSPLNSGSTTIQSGGGLPLLAYDDHTGQLILFIDLGSNNPPNATWVLGQQASTAAR